ncbi:unnamed protein product [Urochloa humidicola]
MAAAAAMEDPVAFRAVQILVSLRSRKLLERPECLPAPAGEASSAAPEERWEARRLRSGGRRGSPVPWTKVLRLPDLAAAAGSGGEAERDAAVLARRPVEAALLYGAPDGSGSPSTRPRHAGEKALAALAPAKMPMKASSPVTPLDYGAGGSGASSSADDAVRPQAQREAREYGGTAWSGGGGGDDEGCSSPAKRARVASYSDDKKPVQVEPSTQSETCASSGKALAFDLNLPPPSDDNGCPDTW